MPPPPPLYTSFPIKGESLSYPPESENLVSTPTSSPASFGVALSCWVGGLQQHSRKKDGLIHLHLNFMERDFSHPSVMERGPSNASEGVYLSLKGGGWFSSDIHLSGCFLRVAQALGGMQANLEFISGNG